MCLLTRASSKKPDVCQKKLVKYIPINLLAKTKSAKESCLKDYRESAWRGEGG